MCFLRKTLLLLTLITELAKYVSKECHAVASLKAWHEHRAVGLRFRWALILAIWCEVRFKRMPCSCSRRWKLGMNTVRWGSASESTWPDTTRNCSVLRQRETPCPSFSLMPCKRSWDKQQELKNGENQFGEHWNLLWMSLCERPSLGAPCRHQIMVASF